MDIINNIVWYFGPVNSIIDKDTNENLTEEQLKTIVFDDSVNENVKICFPLNDDYDFTKKIIKSNGMGCGATCWFPC